MSKSLKNRYGIRGRIVWRLLKLTEWIMPDELHAPINVALEAARKEMYRPKSPNAATYEQKLRYAALELAERVEDHGEGDDEKSDYVRGYVDGLDEAATFIEGLLPKAGDSDD